MWELVRKLFLVGVIAVIAPGSVFQILIGLLVCMTATFISLILRPYKQASDGWLNNVCLAQLTFVLFLGLLLKLDVDIMGSEGSGDQTTSPSEAIAWIIIMSHATLMLFTVIVISYEIKNAPQYQRAVRDADQRKREAIRKHIETWAKGRRAALLAMAKREQESALAQDPEFRLSTNKQMSQKELEEKEKREAYEQKRKEEAIYKKAMEKLESEQNIARHQRELELQAEIARANTNARNDEQLKEMLQLIQSKHHQNTKEAEKMFESEKKKRKNKLNKRSNNERTEMTSASMMRTLNSSKTTRWAVYESSERLRKRVMITMKMKKLIIHLVIKRKKGTI
jgi:hypothetical protein